MQASLSEALPLTAAPGGVVQEWAAGLTLVCLRAPRLKGQCHGLPYGVLRVWSGQCEHFKCGFTPESHPKMDRGGGGGGGG